MVFPSSFAVGERKNFNHFRQDMRLPKIPLSQPPGAATPVRRLVVGEVEGKQPKCRQRRKK